MIDCRSSFAYTFNVRRYSEVMDTPGHTAGHIVYHFPQEAKVQRCKLTPGPGARLHPPCCSACRLALQHDEPPVNSALNMNMRRYSAVFVGDTLFAMGCGRLFEGDAATMWHGRCHTLPATPPRAL